jgi:hypothetical protein
MRGSPLIIIGLLILIVTFPTEAAQLRITLNANDYRIEDTREGSQIIQMHEFGNLLVPGKPMLPAKVFMIALPPGVEVHSVTITGIGGIELPGTYVIKPAHQLLPADNDQQLITEVNQEWQANYNSTYFSDAPYPEKIGHYSGTGQLRKYTFARVAFFPFTYYPKSGRLLLHSACRVVISYSISTHSAVGPEKMEQVLSDTVAEERAARLLVNYQQAKSWYTPNKTIRLRQLHDYVIITSDALQDSVAPFAHWKEYLGYSVQTVTTNWIDNTYSGMDLQEKIRKFLIDKYIDWGIHYVLLVGGVDLIPMRQCFPDPYNHNPGSEYCPPTDYYYADLTGNWDSDGDGFFGELGHDSVDFFPEVIVGRIPWNTEIGSICQKLVRFEQDVGSWKNNALLLGSILNYQHEGYYGRLRTDCAELMEELVQDLLNGWTYTKMYEMEGLRPCTYTCDLPLNQSNVVSNWSTNDYGVVNWGCHGATSSSWRHIWVWDDGDSIPEEPELSDAVFFGNGHVPFLDNDHPSINFCACCNNGTPETNSLARELIRYGSAGIIAATRVSFYIQGWQDKDDGGLSSIDYYFFHYLIGQNERVGDALFDSKIHYLNYLFTQGWRSQGNMFLFCLYGDPSLVREGFAVPVISMHDYEWFDSGNDGYADPGDTISLTVSLLNSGINASSVTLDISSSDPLITMIDSNSNYGSIQSGAIKDNASDPFLFWIADTAPCHTCTLNLLITADSLNFHENIRILIGTPPVLVVDDDESSTYETYATASLERLGVPFHLLAGDDISSDSSLYRYQALIWLTGDNPSPLDSLNIAALSAYLDSGGRLLMTGQDVEGCQNTAFFSNYLHASIVDSSAYRIRVDGVDGDTVSDSLTFLIAGSPGANNQTAPTIISPLPGADSIFSYRMGGCCGVKHDNVFKTVYLSYGFEAIASLALADTVLRRTLEWFNISTGIEEIITWHDLPKTTLSLQVSPSPFTNETKIRCTIQDPGYTQQELRNSNFEMRKPTLKIYDTSGRLVKSFRITPYALRNTLSWDGTDQSNRQLGSGVYFVTLRAGVHSETRKVLSVR